MQSWGCDSKATPQPSAPLMIRQASCGDRKLSSVFSSRFKPTLWARYTADSVRHTRPVDTNRPSVLLQLQLGKFRFLSPLCRTCHPCRPRGNNSSMMYASQMRPILDAFDRQSILLKDRDRSFHFAARICRLQMYDEATCRPGLPRSQPHAAIHGYDHTIHCLRG